MNKKKQMDLIRRRNADLTKQLDDMKFKLEFNEQLNMEGYKRAKDLIVDLEKIKEEWTETLEEVEKERIEYAYLIDEVKALKNILREGGIKIPWYKKIGMRMEWKRNIENDIGDKE